MPYLTFSLILLLGFKTTSAQAMSYAGYSPDSQVLHRSAKSVKLKTKNNTYIDLQLNDRGQLEVAEGVNLNRGDIFYPGQGILSLTQIEKRMTYLGEKIYGRWRLIKYQQYGWVYQLNVASKERPIFHLINAYSGQLIGTITKLVPLQLEGQVAKD